MPLVERNPEVHIWLFAAVSHHIGSLRLLASGRIVVSCTSSRIAVLYYVVELPRYRYAYLSHRRLCTSQGCLRACPRAAACVVAGLSLGAVEALKELMSLEGL